ncbi:Uncharacterised protein [Mycobacteroides abscessus subsp. abscessus]|nr:Uncharacterised protein [Mycobacteroides abscessus subsp. abscessus]
MAIWKARCPGVSQWAIRSTPAVASNLRFDESEGSPALFTATAMPRSCLSTVASWMSSPPTCSP